MFVARAHFAAWTGTDGAVGRTWRPLVANWTRRRAVPPAPAQAAPNGAIFFRDTFCGIFGNPNYFFFFWIFEIYIFFMENCWTSNFTETILRKRRKNCGIVGEMYSKSTGGWTFFFSFVVFSFFFAWKFSWRNFPENLMEIILKISFI